MFVRQLIISFLPYTMVPRDVGQAELWTEFVLPVPRLLLTLSVVLFLQDLSRFNQYFIDKEEDAVIRLGVLEEQLRTACQDHEQASITIRDLRLGLQLRAFASVLGSSGAGLQWVQSVCRCIKCGSAYGHHHA